MSLLPCFKTQFWPKIATAEIKPAKRIKPAIDWSEVDWTKRNCEIAHQLSISESYVSTTRKKIGMPKVTKLRTIDVSGFDWRINDSELCRMHKLSAWQCRSLRILHHAPSPELVRKPQFLPVPGVETVDWTTVDWNKTDTQLAREVGKSKERVRQVRAHLGHPKDTFWDKKFAAFMAFAGERKELTSKDCEGSGVSRNTCVRYCARAGIKYKQIKFPRKTKLPWHLLNWSIPSKLLGDIWGIKRQSIAQHRSAYGIESPAFHCRVKTIPEAYLGIVNAEKEKAAEWQRLKIN